MPNLVPVGAFASVPPDATSGKSTLAAGQPVTLAVVAPSTYTNTVTAPVTVPVGVAVSWTFTTTSQQVRYLAGDAASPEITVVFDPTRASAYEIIATATVRVTIPTSTAPPETSIVTLTLTQQTISDLTTLVQNAAKKLLSVAPSTLQVAPGQLLSLQLVPVPPPDPGGVLKEVQSTNLSTSIRGAIPLGDVVQGLTKPLVDVIAAGAKLFGAADPFSNPPGNSSVFQGVSQEVGSLLERALSIPVAVDVDSACAVRTMVPSGRDAVSSVSPDFLTSPAPAGVLPLGSWPLPFTVKSLSVTSRPTTASIFPVTTIPGLPPTLMVFGIAPGISVLGRAASSAGMVTLSPVATLTVTSDISVPLPDITVRVPGIPIPQTAVACNTPTANLDTPDQSTPIRAAIAVTDTLLGLMPTPQAAVQLFKIANSQVQAVVQTLNAFCPSWQLSSFSDLATCLANAVSRLSQAASVVLVRPIPGTVPSTSAQQLVFNFGGRVGLENAIRSLFSFGPPQSSMLLFEGDASPQRWVKFRGDTTSLAAAMTCMYIPADNVAYKSMNNSPLGTVKSNAGDITNTDPPAGWYEAVLINEG
jgi:hypothetical protein